MAPPPPRVLAELYAVPPAAFTRERDARATALAKAGHADEARAVKQLRRPPASLWATNQLARVEPRGLAAFLGAVERIRATQFRDPGAAAEAVKEQRAQLAALLRRAGEVLSGEGHRPTPALERRISDTLLGAAVDRALADDLRHGRLAAEVAAPGFEALMGTPGGRPLRLVPGGKTTPKATAPTRPTRRHARNAEGRAGEAVPAARQAEARRRERAEALAQEAARREAAASALEREAAARQAAAGRLEREVEAAASALAEKRRGLREAQREAKRAAAAARKARR